EESADLRGALDDPEHLERAFAVCASAGARSAPLSETGRGSASVVEDGSVSGDVNDVAETTNIVARVMALPTRLQETLARSRAAAAAAGASVVVEARPGLGSAHVLLAATDDALAARATGALLEEARRAAHAIVLSAPASVRSCVDPWGAPPPDLFLM